MSLNCSLIKGREVEEIYHSLSILYSNNLGKDSWRGWSSEIKDSKGKELSEKLLSLIENKPDKIINIRVGKPLSHDGVRRYVLSAEYLTLRNRSWYERKRTDFLVTSTEVSLHYHSIISLVSNDLKEETPSELAHVKPIKELI